MNVIICLDDKNGVSFNDRRQSRDRAVTEDMLKLAQGHCIYIKPGSRILFDGLCTVKDNSNSYKDESKVIPEEEAVEVIVEDALKNTAAEDYIFLEGADVKTLPKELHHLIIYRWNRVYPADRHFTLPEDYRRIETVDFPGYSHEKITREIYEIR